MGEDLVQSLRDVRGALVPFQPEAFSGEDCAVLVEELATLEKVCTAARVRATARAGACGVHKERGFADVSDWMARASGSTADLLDIAKQNSLKTLKEQARDRRVRAIDAEELHRLQHAGRPRKAGCHRVGVKTGRGAASGEARKKN